MARELLPPTESCSQIIHSVGFSACVAWDLWKEDGYPACLRRRESRENQAWVFHK